MTGAYSRKMDIRVEIDLWRNGSLSDTINITKSILNYRFQKSIKTPSGTCQMAIIPQWSDVHIMDTVQVLDVLKIYEFGSLKFVGYVRRISYSGEINRSTGEPKREATITAMQFGGLLENAAIGYAYSLAFSGDILNAAAKLNLSLLDASIDGLKYSEIISLLASNFITFLQQTGAQDFVIYIDKYFDAETGLTSSQIPLLPRQYDIYTGVEQEITFWQIAEQIAQKPFNELWIDNGPRKVFIDGNNIDLQDKSTLIFRPTPFDGTEATVANSTSAFSDLPEVYIDKLHIMRFDLSKSMDEVFTLYSVKEATWQFSDIERVILGQYEIDAKRSGIYLLKPLVTELFYTRFEKAKSTDVEIPTGKVENLSKDYAKTLKAWFQDNDHRLSGALTMIVPEDNSIDPKIGEKVRCYGLDGFFYVEGIAHQWQYEGSLISNLTVTRGWNRTQEMKLKDKIFKRNQLK
jgi:hypothetical protein